MMCGVMQLNTVMLPVWFSINTRATNDLYDHINDILELVSIDEYCRQPKISCRMIQGHCSATS